jgi:molybdenum cofactor biosynthesis enzyme MoaA
VKLLSGFGFNKIKLAGGEPTTYPRLVQLIGMLTEIPDIDLSMISNGTLLTEKRLRAYQEAGLSRINVSMNTFDQARYRALQGGTAMLLDHALESIPLLLAAGYQRPKINFIYFGSESDADLQKAIAFAREHQIKITLLNVLPDPDEQSFNGETVTTANLIDKVVSLGVQEVSIDNDPNSFATLVFLLECGVTVEIGHHQVGQANVYQSCAHCPVRFYCRESVFAQRLTPDGILQPCLMRQDNGLDLRLYLFDEIDEATATTQVKDFLAAL